MKSPNLVRMKCKTHVLHHLIRDCLYKCIFLYNMKISLSKLTNVSFGYFRQLILFPTSSYLIICLPRGAFLLFLTVDYFDLKRFRMILVAVFSHRPSKALACTACMPQMLPLLYQFPP